MEHDANLRKVLKRAQCHGNFEAPTKCNLRLDQVPYVGNLFTKGGHGRKPYVAKVKVVKEMPSPDIPEALRREEILLRRLGHYANCFGMTHWSYSHLHLHVIWLVKSLDITPTEKINKTSK